MLKSELLLFALNDMADEDLESARVRLGYRTDRRDAKTLRKRIFTLALAAALILGLGATAYAIAAGLLKTRAIRGEEITGTWNGQYVAYPEAEYELAFAYDTERCYRAQFRAGWLPGIGEPTDTWQDYLAEGENEEVLYVVQIVQADVLKDTKFYFNGHMTVLKEDEWKGFRRIELSGDYRDAVPKGITTMLDRNYLLLFSEKDGYLVFIASSVCDERVLERIAENLQFRLTEEEILLEDRETTVAVLDLGLPEAGPPPSTEDDRDPSEQGVSRGWSYAAELAFYRNELMDGEAFFQQEGAFFFSRSYYDWLVTQPADIALTFTVHGIFPDMTGEGVENNIRTAKVFEELDLQAEVWGGQGTENGLDYAGSACFVTMTPKTLLELSDVLYDEEQFFAFEEQYSGVKARMKDKIYP